MRLKTDVPANFARPQTHKRSSGFPARDLSFAFATPWDHGTGSIVNGTFFADSLQVFSRRFWLTRSREGKPQRAVIRGRFRVRVRVPFH